MNAVASHIVASPLPDTVASALYDVATALPVSADEIRQLDPGLTVTDYAHAGTILEQVQRRLQERAALR